MQKLLVTSDWHVGDYLDRGSTTERLEQFKKLPKRLIEIAKEQGADTLIILGDFKRSPNQRAEMDKLLSDMLDECADYFKNIEYILGQHDSDSKTEVSARFSNLPCMTKRQNIHYVHDHSIVFDDWCNCYFSDYQYKKEVIPPQCDIWFTHFSVGFGQTTDSTKFRLCLCGDIHKQTQIGNIVSVGTPFQHDMNCDHEGHVRLVTLDNGKIHMDNISIISEDFNPLVFAYDDEVLDTKFTNVLRFPRPNKPLSLVNVETNESNELFNLDKYITESMPEEFKSDWEELQKSTKDVDFSSVSLDFKILKVGAHNYWSVSDAEFDFSDCKLINLIGANGSGKTTVTRIINSLFEPKQLLKNYMNMNEGTSDGTCSVWGEILYKGDVYKIKRSLDKTEFWINGVQQTRTNVTQLEQYIMQCLPFIAFNRFFRLKIGSEFFNNNARLPLIQKAFNFDQITKYFKKAEEILKDKQSVYRDFQKQLVGQTAILQDRIKEYETICPTKTLPIINEEDNNRKIAYDVLRNSWTAKSAVVKTLGGLIATKPEVPNISEVECNNKIEELSAKIEKFNNLSNEVIQGRNEINHEIEHLNAIKSGAECPTCHTKLAEVPADIDEQIQKWTDMLNDKNKMVNDVQSDIITLRNQIADYTKMLSMFPKVNQYNENFKKFQTEENALKEIESNPLFFQGEEINKSYDEYKKNKHLIEVITELQSKIQGLKSECEQLRTTVDAKSKEVDKASRFLKLFAHNDPKSIIGDLMSKICKAISDDRVLFEYVGNTVIAFLNVQGEWVNYDRTSGGQRVVVDLLIMQKFSKLLGNVGYVVLDEFLAPCDANHFIECTQALNELNFNQLFYISQQDTFNVECKRILCELGPNNQTVFTNVL